MNNAAHSSHDDLHDHEGLAFDMQRLLDSASPTSRLVDSVAPVPRLFGRRQVILGFAGGTGALALLAACGSDSTTTNSTTTISTTPNSVAESTQATIDTTATTQGSTAETVSTAAAVTETSPGAEIPDETAGPYPGDGTNGPNALADSGVVRNDIRTSFGSLSGTAEGIATTVSLTVVEADTGAPLPGAAVYLWHCDREGKYSMYDIESENYLRGVQVADDTGLITFTSIFPGCYAGRWPHAHFEVYSSLDEATVGTQAIKTSQMAYPEAACNEAYATSGYETSVQNLTRSTLASDNVFRDGVDDQMATITGSPEGGFVASLLVRV